MQSNGRRKSANVTERNLDLILASGSESQKLRYMETFTENTDITVSMHRVSAPRDAAAQHLALTTLLRRKGRVLDAVGGALQALRDRMSDEDRAALDRLSAARAQLARLVLRGPGRQEPAAFNRDVAAAEEQLQQAEREIERPKRGVSRAVAPGDARGGEGGVAGWRSAGGDR